MKPALLTFAVVLFLGWLALYAAKADEREAAYDYLVASVKRNTGRAASQFVIQTNLSAPKIMLTNRVEVVKRLTLGGRIIVRSLSAVVAPGDPLNPMIPREYPVITPAQALIWKNSTNHP